MAEYFEPGKPNIGYSGKDQDKPKGMNIGSSEALRSLGEVLAGDQGFENTPDAMDREYTSQVLTAGLSARIQTLEGKMATGAEYVDNFNRINSATLGSPQPGTVPAWTVFGTGQPLEIIDQAAQIEQGGLLPTAGTRYALCPQAASASDYSVLAIVHPLSKTGKIAGKARTTLYGRCNAAGTEGVYVDFWGVDGNDPAHCDIGRFTRNGNSVNRSPWKSVDRSYSFSSTIELRMIGTTYLVVIDGVEVLEHVDISNFPVDGNHRYSMFSCMTWTGFFGAKPQFSAGLTQFAIRGVDLTAIQNAQKAAEDAQIAADNAVETAVTEATNAAVGAVPGAVNDAVAPLTELIDSKANYSDIPTNVPLWHSINPNDDPVFPYNDLVYVTNATTSSGGNTTTSESKNPTFSTSSGEMDLGYIRATRNRDYTQIGFMTAKGAIVGSGPFEAWLHLYKMDLTTGVLTLLWNSGNIKPSIQSAGSGKMLRFAMPTLHANQGEVFAAGLVQRANALNPSYAIYGIKQPFTDQPAGVYPRGLASRANVGTSFPSASSISPAAQVWTDENTPWFILG